MQFTSNDINTVILAIALMGLINWLLTCVLVETFVFKDVREATQKLGRRVAISRPRIGEKIEYFPTCFMCVGVWIGFWQHFAIGSIVHADWRIAFLVNGLIYKAVGHLILQLSKVLHYSGEVLKGMAARSKQEKFVCDLQILSLMGCGEGDFDEATDEADEQLRGGSSAKAA